MTLAAGQDRTDGAPQPGATQGRSVLPGPLKLRGRFWFLIALPVWFAVYLASGFYVVGPDQRAVVRRFGAVADQVGPGMHYLDPWPVEQVDILKTTSVMKVGVGFALQSGNDEMPTGIWSCNS